MKTDQQLQLDVLAELKWHPGVNAARIGVEVRDGVVTLAGHVDSYGEKVEAERAAQQVAGVKALAIEMQVQLPGPSKRSDADIAQAAKNVVEWMTYLPNDSIKVMVEGGWLTLVGNVDKGYYKELAGEVVRHLWGVTGITNQITVTPQPSSQVVREDIEAALHRRAAWNAPRIVVSVKGDEVTLSGSVHSWPERDLAQQSAWRAPGVRNVLDHIAVL